MTNEEMRKESGDLASNDQLLSFLYLLMRDELPVGKVEQLVMEVENLDGYNLKYCNGWLAKYAQNLSQRIKKGSELDEDRYWLLVSKGVDDDAKYKEAGCQLLGAVKINDEELHIWKSELNKGDDVKYKKAELSINKH